MTCTRCQHQNVKRFGVYGRKRIQRFRCKSCDATFSEDRPKPLGNHYIDLDRAVQVISLLVEGMSIRAAARISPEFLRTAMAARLTSADFQELTDLVRKRSASRGSK